MAKLRAVEQIGFDEQTIEDTTLEAALEERERRKESLGAVRKEYDEAHQAAVGAIATLELPEGGVARVGRFRITRTWLRHEPPARRGRRGRARPPAGRVG